MSQTPQEARPAGLIKSQLDLGGGLFLVGIALVGLVGGYDLPTGSMSEIGSGLLPRAVSLLVGAFGVLLVVHAFLYEGAQLERWKLRGPVFVLGAVLLFAMLIRGTTLHLGGIFGIPVLASVNVPGLGLLLAGPIAVIVSAYADPDTRLSEIVLFAIAMTLLSGLLFKEILNLPIPWDPVGIIPGFVNDAYEAMKAGLGHGVDAVKNLFVN